jgi:YHYH protein
MMPTRATFVFLCLALPCLTAPADPTKPAAPTNDAAIVRPVGDNLAKNFFFTERSPDGMPADYTLTGRAVAQYLGDRRRDVTGWGVALSSGPGRAASGERSGSVAQTVAVDPSQGRWYRFSFRGLPQDHFAVATSEDLYMKVEFFGNGGKVAYDAKAKPLYSQVERARKDMTVNGDFHVGGAAVWQTYELDFSIPFPQVDSVRLSVGFRHGEGGEGGSRNDAFYVTNFSLVRLADAPELLTAKPTTQVAADQGDLVSLGGRWYFNPQGGSRDVPAQFDYTNADRLLYFDGHYTAPFLGNTSTWLRVGDKDEAGNVATRDVWVRDNVTLSIQDGSLVIHTKGLPNHPTGKFPGVNPNYIQEQDATYYLPLNPKINPAHFVTTRNNSNHALNMGPIGIALNGVVFFNPFDAGSQDASSLMDSCCGHPNPDGLYHYHKYPICMNSPWSDQGATHSPLIGFAFDGFPIYGPYESANLMAKDLVGDKTLNDFNIHYDSDRGWHYHVTPGKFPYIIGGYWGTVDRRDTRPPHGGGMNGTGNMTGGRFGPPGVRPPGGGFGPGNGPPSP